jgi:tetratricopeptide (TPR) repeat protein
VAFARDGRRLVAAGDGGLVQVLDAETGAEVRALRGHRDVVRRALFSPDGRLLATAGGDQTIRLWDMTTEPPPGQEAVPVRVLVGPSEAEHISGLSFSADGRRLASSGLDQTIRIWDVDSGDETLTLRGYADYVAGVAFSPDGRLLAAAGGRSIKLWEAGDAGPDAPPGDALAWHRRQADECQTARPPEWWGVAFHVSRQLEAGPADWRLHWRRAAAEVELGQWQRALDDCERSIALGATEPGPGALEAEARLEMGDTDGYRRACAALVERFGRTDKPEDANEVAWACVLTPGAVAEWERPVALATMATKADPTNPNYQNTLGTVLYRAGRLADAESSLQESVRLSRGGEPEDWLFLAMICHRQGNKDEARRWLAKALAWCDAVKRASPPQEDPPLPSRLLVLQLFRSEAEDVLAGASELAR